MKLENKDLKKPGFFSSIRFKLIVWFFLVLFTPFSIGGAALYFYSISKIEESIINYLSSIADLKVDNINTFLCTKKARVIDFSSDGFIRDRTELIGYYGKVKERMVDLSSHLAKNIAPLDPDILEIFIMDLEGEIIASSNPQNILLKRQNTDYFINAKRYGIYVSSFNYCMDGNVPVVEISRLLTSRKSEEVKPVGVIVNRIRGNSIVDKVKRGMTVGDQPARPPGQSVRAGIGSRPRQNDVGLANGMAGRAGGSDNRLNLKIYVLDSNYQILGGSGIFPASRYLSDEKSFKNTINTKLVEIFDKSGENYIGMYENHLGLSVMGTIRHLEDLDLFILLEIDERDAFAALTRVKWSAIIMSPVVFMAILAVAFVLSIRLSRPITVMTDITRSIASGHLKERVPVNRKDELGHLANSFNDMTFRLEESRKQLQDYALSLEESENKFRKMSALAQDAIVMLDSDEKVSYWNKAAERTFGYLEEEISGKNLHEIIIPDRFRKRHLEGFEKFKSNGLGRFIGKTIKVSAIRRDGTEFPIELSLSGVKLRGKWNVIGIIRDISGRKLAEKKLRMSQKMASVGRLSAGVFHEILNPLNIISSHVQLLLMEAEKGSKTEEDLQSIREEIGRIVTISDRLLRFSNKAGLATGDVEINDLLEKVIIVVEPDMKLSNIRFIRKFEERLPAVMANSDGLRQVFLNLITNARDAMPEGGTLTVETRKVVSSESGVRSKREKIYEPEGDFVEISFEDTGCGIASKNIDKIFEPFFSTKKEVVGVGLGLSESHSIIEAYGGTITVKSEKGKGSTFIIDLPC